jgi:hypothetical protein
VSECASTSICHGGRRGKCSHWHMHNTINVHAPNRTAYLVEPAAHPPSVQKQYCLLHSLSVFNDPVKSSSQSLLPGSASTWLDVCFLCAARLPGFNFCACVFAALPFFCVAWEALEWWGVLGEGNGPNSSTCCCRSFVREGSGWRMEIL